MKLEISKRARRHIEKRQAWWSEHRPAARRLFLDELAAAERQLRAAPELGSIYVERNARTIRRVLLPKPDTHVYYAVDASRDLVTVLAVWGARRGGSAAHGPKPTSGRPRAMPGWAGLAQM